MSVRKFFRAVLAYIFASLVTLPVSGVGYGAAAAWGQDVTFWQIASAVWLLVCGVPSCGWAVAALSRYLGVRPAVNVLVGDRRQIPVVGALLGDVGRVLFPGAPGNTVAVADDLVIACGRYEFKEADVLAVLRKGWARQMVGDKPFTRSYWLSHNRGPFWGDRAAYDALMLALDGLGVVRGRGDRSSGRMLVPPLSAVHDLKHRLVN